MVIGSMGGRQLSIVVALAALFGGGCPTVDLDDTPPTPGSCRPDFTYYEEVIWPSYLLAIGEQSCVNGSGCHGSGNAPRSSLQLDNSSPVNHEANYDVTTRFLDCNMEELSPLLTKPLGGQDPHEGGDIFTNPSTSRTVFLDWFYQ